MTLIRLALLATCAAAAPIAAQDVPPPAEARTCAIPAGTIVSIEVTVTIDSKTAKTGETFPVRLAEPLVVNGETLIPAGTEGGGQIIHAAKKKLSGSGELILAARYLELGGTRVPLRSFRIVQAGPASFSVLISGGTAILQSDGYNVSVPAGARADAKVAMETALPCPAAA